MKKLTLILSVMIALVGLNANAAMYIVGSGPFNGWNPANGVEMQDIGDGIYSYQVAISGAVTFVFGDGLSESSDDWDTFNSEYRHGPAEGDMNINVNEWILAYNYGYGAYKLVGDGTVYTFFYDTNNDSFRVDGNEAHITYETLTVAGSNTTLFGTAWDPTNTANDMTLVDGLYTWEKKDIILNAGGFEFKVVADHDPDYAAAWPANNYYQAIDNRGRYNIKITFDPEDEIVDCDADLIELVPDTAHHTYTVAGAPAALFGTEWDPTNTNNDMYPNINGVLTWKKENVALTAGTISFKVVEDHSWNNPAYPSNNCEYTIEEDGNYVVTINFNEATKEVSIWTYPYGYKRGDVNMDGAVDINDVTRLIDVKLGKEVEYNETASDCNVEGGDGTVDINDITALIARMLNGSW